MRCAEHAIGDFARTLKIGATTLREGDLLTLDGDEGVFYAGAAPVRLEYPEELLERLAALRRGREPTAAQATAALL